MAITKKDVETLKEVFATKDELNSKFDQVLTGQDKIIKELERAREDRVFAFVKDKDQDSRLDNLDSRVKKLETARL